jgi:LmbE family N-acetylglucosaminyl deacetylase
MKHLIVSPHLDDAWFSLGGSLNEWRKRNEAVLIVNVFSIQSWTKYEEVQLRDAVSIRKREERLNARRDGVQLKFLDLHEGILRGYPLQFPEPVNWKIDLETLDHIVTNIGKVIRAYKPDAIYFPLGIGGHVDHLLVREASAVLGSAFRLGDINILFYEDLPYASYDAPPASFIEQHRLSPVLQQIDIEHKLVSVRNYKSQIYDETVASIREYAGGMRSDDLRYERLWRPDRNLADPFQIQVL